MQNYGTVAQRRPTRAAGIPDEDGDIMLEEGQDPSIEESRDDFLDDRSPEQAAAEQRGQALQAFANMLVKTRDEAVQARASAFVEQRWLQDLDAYHGKDIANQSQSMVKNASDGNTNSSREEKSKPARSTVVVNITRSKTNAAEARLADMLFPVDDRNWGIKPTPNPELASEADSGETAITHMGQPLTITDQSSGQQRQATSKDLAKQVMEDANNRAEAMQREIDDQLTECRYNGVGREVIHDAALLGTGVIKGPVAKSRVRKLWRPVTDGQRTVHVLEFKIDQRPGSERVNPWNLFPDPKCGETIHDGEYVWERKYVTRKYLRKLAITEGFLPDQIAMVLSESPQRTPTYYDEHQMRIMRETGYTFPDSTQYELWEYHGEARPGDLSAAGCECQENELMGNSATVLMVNGRVIFADINPMDTGDFPYDVFVWEKMDGSIWGHGVPHLMRYGQQVITAAWRMVMDHGGSTVGPQVGIKRSKVTPADGRYEITGRKLWYINEDEQDANKAMAVWDIPSHIKDYLVIIEAAMKFADDETNLPMIAQGERGTAPDTVGGMSMLMNAANVVLRRLVKQFDDMVTRPHIRRYYDFNMQYSTKQDIKGDYEIDARGSTALLLKDLQNQAMMKWLQALTNPAIGYLLDDEKLVEMALQADHLTPDQIFAPKETREERRKFIIAAAGGGKKEGEDKQGAAAQVAGMRLQQTREQIAADKEDSDAERQLRREELGMERELAMLKYANDKQVSLEQVKSMLAGLVIKEQGADRRLDTEANLRRTTGAGV